VRIGFDELDPRILPDMGVKVSFLEDREEASKAPNVRPVVRIPSAAVFRDGDTSYVWRVQDDHVERVAVTTAGERDGQIEVVARLNAGDTVVAAPVEGLEQGDEIQIRND
jgi:hypothetical protein